MGTVLVLTPILEKVDAAKATFHSLTEAIKTDGSAGRMMMQMLGSFVEFERTMVRERTKAGLENARTHGRAGGRRFKLSPEQKKEVISLLDAGRSAADIARLFRVHRSTISRLIAKKNVQEKLTTSGS